MDVEEAQADSARGTLLEDEREKKQFKMISPPVDWTFNALLVKIDKGMTSKELEEVKTLFKGQEGIGGGVLDEIKRPLDLFDALRKRTFLDRYNMLYLQAMLFHIRRNDLFDLAVAYAESCKDVVHFKSPPVEPANGYVFVEFHIGGTESYTKDSLEKLRKLAAELLCVEPTWVTIAGIEPSSSLLITLMVPKRCIHKLETAVQNHETAQQFLHLGIDRLKINGRTISLKEETSEPFVQQQQLADMYKKLRATEEQLEERELECLKLNQRLKMEEAATTELRSRMMALLMDIVFRAYANIKVPKLSRQSALAFLRHCFRRIEQRNITDETRVIILNLLDAYGLAISTRFREAQIMSAEELQAKSFELLIAVERGQLGLFGNFKSELEKALPKRSLVTEVQRTSITQFDNYTFRVLHEISNLLTEKERQQLLGKYSWPENENLTKHIQLRDRPFLACLIHKENELADSAVDQVQFVIKLLQDVKRDDLVKKFVALMTESTHASSEELKRIQHQLDLVLEKLGAIQATTSQENMPLQPSISFGPSLKMKTLKLNFGSEIIRKLMLDQANSQEMPYM